MINPPLCGWLPNLVAQLQAQITDRPKNAKETLNAAKRYVDVYKLGAVSWHLREPSTCFVE